MAKKMEFAPPAPGIDVMAPLIYMWEIRDSNGEVVGRYIGKANGGEKRPTQHYRRNVNKLLQGLPYKKGKNYRRVHVALANAVKAGYGISLSYLCNVPDDQNIFEVETRYIREYGCNAADGIGLNGLGKTVDVGMCLPTTEGPAPAAPLASMPGAEPESPEHLDLEDFLECIEDNYPDLFEIRSGSGRYSLWIEKRRILRALQSGPSGKVHIKRALTSLREKTKAHFYWDGSVSQITAAIDGELEVHRKTGDRSAVDRKTNIGLGGYSTTDSNLV